MRFLFFLLLCAAPVPSRAAQQSSPPPLTVDGAVALAVKNNPRLLAAARDVGAAQSGVRAARARANPEIVFAPGFTAGGSDEELRIQQPLELMEVHHHADFIELFRGNSHLNMPVMPMQRLE